MVFGLWYSAARPTGTAALAARPADVRTECVCVCINVVCAGCSLIAIQPPTSSGRQAPAPAAKHRLPRRPRLEIWRLPTKHTISKPQVAQLLAYTFLLLDGCAHAQLLKRRSCCSRPVPLVTHLRSTHHLPPVPHPFSFTPLQAIFRPRNFTDNGTPQTGSSSSDLTAAKARYA